ncbi:MAG: glycosyltransferase family 39 protein [Acidobacteriaceae bacterium]
MTHTTIVRPTDPTLRPALRLAAIFAAITFALHLFTILWSQHLGYGYFRDELYYIACGHHLAWGYVDQGPIVAVQARLAQTIFGSSLLGIRMFSVLAECAAIFLTGILTWSLGGRRPAQSLAMLGILIAPVYIGSGDYLSMNSFEPMFWTACVLALVLLLRGRSPRTCWIVFGISAGLGLLNKPSMTFFLIALGIGLLLTPQRRILFTRHAALGIALLLLIASPNVVWQIHNHWPTLEFLHNGRVDNKNVVLNPLRFLLAQWLQMHPWNALLWVTGLVALLRGRSLPSYRWLGYMYIAFFALMYALHAKDYYLAPVYPALFAAGAIAWERRFAHSRSVQRGSVFAFPILETLLILNGLITLPMASPILRPATWVAYTHALHFTPGNTENAATSELPQFFADRFGWQEYADQVVHVFRSLTPEEQKRVCIYGQNYGEAGAIDFLGRREEPRLPPAISNHNAYWMWGLHGCDGQLLISISDDTPQEMLRSYRSVQIVGHMSNPLAMPYEHRNIYLCRGRRSETPIQWDKEKDYN